MAGKPTAPIRLSLAHLTVLDADPLTLIDAAAAGGFDAIGLRIVAPLPSDRIVPVIGDEQMIRAIERRLDATGIRILDIEAVWLMAHTDVAALQPALELGARLGARHLLVVGNDPDWSRQRDNFIGLCDLAGRARLGIALEPMSYVELRTVTMARRLLSEADQPNAGILVDALHFFRSGATPHELSEVDAGLFPYIHLCDALLQSPPRENLRKEGRSGRLYPGDGELPLAELLRALPGDVPIAIEAPCEAYAGLAATERGRLCGAATRTFLDALR